MMTTPHVVRRSTRSTTTGTVTSPNTIYPFLPRRVLHKVLWAANHGSHIEFVDDMQEMMLNAYLTYSAKPAYVFHKYTWERAGYEISYRSGKPIPAHIPLSALISGPIIGDPMPDRYVSRSVSREYFLNVFDNSPSTIQISIMLIKGLPTMYVPRGDYEERCSEAYSRA
ncbi:hypothetical protein MVEN_00710400 [Mycena venus]|uniref:Uncharacterized protein n=1 Tax=Mycena venus TaxID=2733690 RepID=A0A8H6YEU6_9AGAR|nr:hypothetical protein MVEN_00710400 [Mycena venus]